MPVSLLTSRFRASMPFSTWVSGSLPLLLLYTAFSRLLRVPTLIMVSRGRLMAWISLFTLSKVNRIMVSVLPPPAVSWPTRRKVYTPSLWPL